MSDFTIVGRTRVAKLFIDDGVGAAFLQGLECKLIAIELVAVESNENTTRRAVTTISGDTIFAHHIV